MQILGTRNESHSQAAVNTIIEAETLGEPRARYRVCVHRGNRKDCTRYMRNHDSRTVSLLGKSIDLSWNESALRGCPARLRLTVHGNESYSNSSYRYRIVMVNPWAALNASLEKKLIRKFPSPEPRSMTRLPCKPITSSTPSTFVTPNTAYTGVPSTGKASTAANSSTPVVNIRGTTKEIEPTPSILAVVVVSVSDRVSIDDDERSEATPQAAVSVGLVVGLSITIAVTLMAFLTLFSMHKSKQMQMRNKKQDAEQKLPSDDRATTEMETDYPRISPSVSSSDGCDCHITITPHGQSYLSCPSSPNTPKHGAQKVS